MLEMDQKVFITSMKHAFQYRLNMLLQVVIGPLYIMISYIVWKAVFQTSGLETIGGFTFQTMLIYVIINQLINNVIYDDIIFWMANDVQKGYMTIFLIKPLSYLRYHFLFKLGNRFIALLLQTVPVAIIMGFIFGFEIYLGNNILLFLISIIIAFIISFLIRFFLGIFSFWFIRIHGIGLMYNMLHYILIGSFIPLSLYPELIQKISFFLPFQYAAYIPVQIFLGTTEFAGYTFTPITLIGFGLIQIFILLIAVKIFWHFSIKKFCGVGT